MMVLYFMNSKIHRLIINPYDIVININYSPEYHYYSAPTSNFFEFLFEMIQTANNN
jgi:hypothetical protein